MLAVSGGRLFGLSTPRGKRGFFYDAWAKGGDDWLVGEYYARGKPLSYHMRYLPRDVCWYADPAGANEQAELRCADFQVLQGFNALRPGIMAVTARLESGRLKVLDGRCPNLLAEAGLYHYGETPQERNAEVPVDEYNHALGALRYMTARLDAGRRRRGGAAAPPAAPRRERPDWWLRWNNEALWTRL